jgi:hypothetical protein
MLRFKVVMAWTLAACALLGLVYRTSVAGG